MPPNEGDLLDSIEGAGTAAYEVEDDVPDLETLQVLAANESIRELVLPILDDMLADVLAEIADMQYFISTGPLGELEVVVADNSGLVEDIDAELEGL
jgi:hypothetical protein